jgi:hypothetical protein
MRPVSAAKRSVHDPCRIKMARPPWRRWADTAVTAGITATGHAPLLTLCRRLVEAGHDPSTPLEAYRGTILCLRARSIGAGARLTVREGPDGKPRFATYRPAPNGRQSCGGSAAHVSNAGEAAAHEGALPKTPRSGRPQARPVL